MLPKKRAEEMAAALILFRRKSHIRLPADGWNLVQKFGDSVGPIVTRNPRGKANWRPNA